MALPGGIMRIGSVAVLAVVAAFAAGAEPAHAQRKTIFSQCASDVGMQYKPSENRWYFHATGHGLAQEQNFYNCIDARVKSQSSSSHPVASHHKTMPKRHAAAAAAARKQPFEEVHLDKSALSGSESRISAMNYVNADCSSGPLPEVRIVTPPGSGELRMEPIKYALNRDKKNPRAHCNGTIVDAVAVFYKSKSDFAGADKVVLDVDFKAGAVKRFIYAINIH
jgi:hypothetical protein